MRYFQTLVDVREGQSGVIVMTLRDQAGDLVEKAALSSITLDLYHWYSNQAQVINARDAQDVLDDNGGEFFDDLQTMQDEDGNDVTYNFRWDYTPEDTSFLRSDTGHQTEEHIAHFRFKWDSDTKSQGHEVRMTVFNFRRFAP